MRYFRCWFSPEKVSLIALWAASTYFIPNANGQSPLPQNGSFVAGSGAINTKGNALDIVQTTPRGIIDWRSFSIGAGRSVSIANGNGATLNRVTGTDKSLIDGMLKATGSVYLINAQGIVIGRNGVVSTGGRFVASTLDANNDSFMKGDELVLGRGGAGGAGVIVNLGKIGSSGGDVFLISRVRTSNRGSIDASNGTAELVAADEVLLKDVSSAAQVFVDAGSGGSVFNRGTIRAAQIELHATGGNVFALAGRHAALRATGTAKRDGHVWLVAEGGTVHAHGSIEAVNADGTGGTLDMQARAFHFDNLAAHAVQWNLTTPTFTIGPKSASTITQNLSAGASVTVNTTGPRGDINVLSDLRWSGDASLALNAARSVKVAKPALIGNRGTGNLTLRADANGIDNGGSVINRGMIDWSASKGVVAALYDLDGQFCGGLIHGNADWSAAPFTGLVTQVTAYQLINSFTDLRAVSQNLSGTYALGKDIAPAANESGRVRIANVVSSTFTGQFDGQGHLIHNLVLLPPLDDGSWDDYGTLFPTIGASGVVRNVSLVDSFANAINSPMAILAGVNNGRIVNVHTTGDVISDGIATSGGAGLVWENAGTIERSSSVVGLGYQGSDAGLVQSNDGLIVQSFAEGYASGGSHSNGAGLVGGNAGTIRQSYAIGAVGDLENGGLVGYNSGVIEESFVAAIVGPGGYPQWAAGVAETNLGTIAKNVYWDVQVTGQPKGVGDGTPMPDANGLTTAQMSRAASFGPTWDFGPNGV